MLSSIHQSAPVRRAVIAAAVGMAMCVTLAAPAGAQTEPPEGEPLLNPLPDPTVSTLGIEVEEFVQLPESTTTPEPLFPALDRYNRINQVIEVPDGSGRLAVPDLNAMLYLVDKESGEYTAYLDVREEFVDNFHNSTGLGLGFGFVEFHPEFADNGIFYTVHSEAGSALVEDEPDFPGFGETSFHSVVTEWTADDPSADTFSGTQRELLRLAFNSTVHNVQEVAFNPTVEVGDADYGMLYIAVGDGGNGVDSDNPQDLSTPHGTVFRIDPFGDDSGNGEYGIPADNPFVDVPDALGEIYALGLRNPHRISWDLGGDHAMYLANIGEYQVESVYEVRAGDNFGWSVREGPFVAYEQEIYPLPENDAEYGFTYPVVAYDHNRDPDAEAEAGVAMAGGSVYRGDIPELRGYYFFSDIPQGVVMAAEVEEMERNDGDIEDLAPIIQLRVYHDGEETTFQELVRDERVDLRFGADADSELYLVSKADGKVWRVIGAREVDEPEPMRYGFFLTNDWEGGDADYAFMYGRHTDEALIGDWDGDGRDSIMVRRGDRFFVNNAPRGGPAESVFTYGRPGDVVLAGDWDGDGIDTLAVRRGNAYHVNNSLRGGDADHVIHYGRSDDEVMVGDWDGDSRDTFAVRRGATYHVKNTMRGGEADVVFTYGRDGDVTIAGDWDGDGYDTLAVRRGKEYHINNSLSGGPAELVMKYGHEDDDVLVGDWDGDGTDTLGVRRTPSDAS